MNTYQEHTINEKDSKEEKINKLYLAICSVGDQLYSAGSHMQQIVKQINELEKVVADFRKELGHLKKDS